MPRNMISARSFLFMKIFMKGFFKAKIIQPEAG